MISIINHNHKNYTCNLKQPIDISIPLLSKKSTPKCFYAPDYQLQPVVAGDFIGDIKQGSVVNFKNIFINPHGNGTHTECVAHILDIDASIHSCLTEFHFIAQLHTVTPSVLHNNDSVIDVEALHLLHNENKAEAIVLRTQPNNKSKLSTDYSGSNPSYFSQEAIIHLNELGYIHLLTDLPSVDREEDGGKLAAHKAFWLQNDSIQFHKTITEMIFVDSHIPDGMYLCNIHIMSIDCDASPSKIILYALQ